MTLLLSFVSDLLSEAVCCRWFVCFNSIHHFSETNLKLRQALHVTQRLDSPDAMCKLRAQLRCDVPNDDLYVFHGSLLVEGERDEFSADIHNVAWRGSLVLNTRWLLGLVIYTGQDTKLILNSQQAPSKRSHIDKLVNRFLFVIFAIMLIMCSISALMYAAFAKTNEDAWYLKVRCSLIFFCYLYNLCSFQSWSHLFSFHLCVCLWTPAVHSWVINLKWMLRCHG